jgi:hypothetical protein
MPMLREKAIALDISHGPVGKASAMRRGAFG